MPSVFLSSFVSNVVTVATSTIIPAVAANTTVVVFGLSASNRLASPVNVSFYVNRSSSQYSVITNGVVPVGSSLVVAGNDQKLVLQAGDSLTANASAAGAVDVVCSYLSQT